MDLSVVGRTDAVLVGQRQLSAYQQILNDRTCIEIVAELNCSLRLHLLAVRNSERALGVSR